MSQRLILVNCQKRCTGIYEKVLFTQSLNGNLPIKTVCVKGAIDLSARLYEDKRAWLPSASDNSSN